ncbi:hypothetical protein OPT61_g2491 [Boeremia exigua]|uniref:Uncharacterized protein n=1 Tax=Boeremia exigua TaxID=749465 RepID=A0ACC2ILQ6_9PLEO|nr:hypothetical protein OPT61_g2491 [Boeremia exigua]
MLRNAETTEIVYRSIELPRLLSMFDSPGHILSRTPDDDISKEQLKVQLLGKTCGQPATEAVEPGDTVLSACSTALAQLTHHVELSFVEPLWLDTLVDAFIQDSVDNGSQAFSIGWVLSDTTFTIKNLQSGEADLGISYVPAAEQVAAEQGIINADTGRYYLFRDHFIIAGPRENSAGISSNQSVTSIFAKIYQTGKLNTARTAIPTRFLTRYDKSATNLKEATLWLGIGQVPWALPYSTWYHQFPAFPIQALGTASLSKEYTLTDRGTFLSLEQLQPNLTGALEQFKVGTDDANDPLLLPGHLLVGNKARNATLAQQFAAWATSARGQSVVTGFQKNGKQFISHPSSTLPAIMLSTRGREYAALDLAAGYLKERGQLYDRNESPAGLVSLTNAENACLRSAPSLRSLQLLKTCALTYGDGPFGSNQLRQAMADFMNANFLPALQITTDEVSFVAGVTALNNILARCVAEEGEGLLLGMLIYGSFAPDLQSTTKCKLIYASFDSVDQFSVRAVECYERAFHEAQQNGIKVRALVITNPHNPLGRCYPKDTLEAIDFAAAGLRLGCLISKNPSLTKAVRSLARFHGASPMTDAIATAILRDVEFHSQFLAESQRSLKLHRTVTAQAFDNAGIPYIRNANAGFFLWIDLSACLHEVNWDAEDELRQKLYDHGVEMSSGRAYHDEVPGKFRFIFSVDKETLVEGLLRLVSFYGKYRVDKA